MPREPLSDRFSACPVPPTDDYRRAELVGHITAHMFGVQYEQMLVPTRRKQTAALARQVAMYVCHVTLGLNFKDIGEVFGRDRSTASHACKVIEDRRDERDFDEFIRRIEDAALVLGIAPPLRIPAFGCR